MKYLANHKVGDIHGLKLELLKWVANDLCEPITKLFNLVAKEDFPTSWTINIIQMIFKSSERRSMGDLYDHYARNNLWQTLWLCFRKNN